MICEYGCGLESKFVVTSKNKQCCSESYKQCPSVKEKNKQGCKAAFKAGRRRSDGSQFDGKRGWSKGKNLVPNEDVFIESSTYTSEFVKARIKKDALLSGACNKCGITDTWQGEPIVLELDHINGTGNDNRIENLRLLCPNCHSQTPTFRGRNKNNGKTKVSDEELLTAYHKYGNIRQTLIAVGLAPKGGNYTRMSKLINTEK